MLWQIRRGRRACVISPRVRAFLSGSLGCLGFFRQHCFLSVLDSPASGLSSASVLTHWLSLFWFGPTVFIAVTVFSVVFAGRLVVCILCAATRRLGVAVIVCIGLHSVSTPYNTVACLAVNLNILFVARRRHTN